VAFAPDPTAHPSGLTARFASLVHPHTGPCGLDVTCAVIAAHFTVGADPDGTDLRAVRSALDALAARVTTPTFEGVADLLARAGYGGSGADYLSAAGSFLPAVLLRRRGLPILLAVVAVEVARRVGVGAQVVGMPGHVLVSTTVTPRVLADPFHRRASLDQADARVLFERVHGGRTDWRDSFLDPIGPRAVLDRILANLARRYRADKEHRKEATALGLRCLLPGIDLDARVSLAGALARSGAFDRAASELEAVAAVELESTDPDALRARAERWRARLN